MLRPEQSRAEQLKDLAATAVAPNAQHVFALLLAENNEVQNALAQVTAGTKVDSVVQELQNRLGFSDARKEMIRDAMVAAASMAVGGKAGRGTAGGAKGTTNAPNTPKFITDSAGNTIDLDHTKGLREPNVTFTGTRGGVQYPLQGQTPDSYANLGNGHVVVYGPEGRALYDVSSSRIQVVEWNQAPNGTYFPKKGSDTKVFEGNVPQSVLDGLGLK